MTVTAALVSPRIESRHLRLVLAIVDEGGLTRAGQRLHLSQSALSHQLKQVESSLGVTLFLRIKRRLVLTDAGRRLVDRARPIVADLDALRDDMNEHTRGERGTLRIATECYTAYEWLPPVLKRFHKRHAGVDVSIAVEATSDPIRALSAGDIDLAIVTGDLDAPGLETHELFRDELLLVVPPGHRLARRRVIRPADLTRERLLLYTPPGENFFYRDFFASGAHSPARVDVVKLTEAVLSMVRAGLGITVAAAWAIAPSLRSGALVGVRLGREGFVRQWRAAVRCARGAVQPGYVSDFVALVASSRSRVR